MKSWLRIGPALMLLGVCGWAGIADAQAPTPSNAPASTPSADAPKAAAPKAAKTKAAKKPANVYKPVIEQKAMDLLKATSDRLAAAKSMSFTAVVGYEYPSKLGPPIVYSTRYDVTMQRPNKLRIPMRR